MSNSHQHTFIQNMKKILEKQKKETLQKIEELTPQDPFKDVERLNDNAASDTEANEEAGHDRYQAILGELKSDIQSIDAALERIEKGTYGVCANCGTLIPEERLLLVPTATMCMDCKNS